MAPKTEQIINTLYRTRFAGRDPMVNVNENRFSKPIDQLPLFRINRMSGVLLPSRLKTKEEESKTVTALQFNPTHAFCLTSRMVFYKPTKEEQTTIKKILQETHDIFDPGIAEILKGDLHIVQICQQYMEL